MVREPDEGVAPQNGVSMRPQGRGRKFPPRFIQMKYENRNDRFYNRILFNLGKRPRNLVAGYVHFSKFNFDFVA